MKNWLIGDFETGTVDRSDVLPVIHNSDKPTIDINAGDNVTFNLSKKDIPEDWKSYLKEFDRLIVLEDDSKDWNDDGAILFAGFLNKRSGDIGSTIAVQAAGLREYLSSRIINNVFTGVNDKPSAGITFAGSDYQGLMRSIITHCFDDSGIPTSSRKPPAVLGNIDGGTGTGVTSKILLSDMINYSSVLDDLRDVTSTNGNEYYFKPRWRNSSRNSIVWDVKIGTDSAPHINEATTFTIPLTTTSTFKSSKFSLELSSEGVANRIIGQSKAGDTEKDNGADLTVLTSTSGAKVLVDTAFNPGVELTSDQMNAQLTARLNSMLSATGTATYTIEEADASQWINNLGKTIVFSGQSGTDSAGYNITVRCTSVTFSASNNTIEVGVSVPQPRYPKLPNSKTSGNKVNGQPIGNNKGGIGGNGVPVVPKNTGNFPGYGGGSGSGGGGTPLPTKPDFSTPPMYSDKEENIFGDVKKFNVRTSQYIAMGTAFQSAKYKKIYVLNVAHQLFQNYNGNFTQPNRTTMLGKDIVVSSFDLYSMPSSLNADPYAYETSVLPYTTYGPEMVPTVDASQELPGSIISNQLQSACFVVGNRIYVYFHSSTNVKNEVLGKTMMKWKSKSFIFSKGLYEDGALNGSSEWRLENWRFHNPQAPEECFFPMPWQLAVIGGQGKTLAVFGGYFTPTNDVLDITNRTTPTNSGTKFGVDKRIFGWTYNLANQNNSNSASIQLGAAAPFPAKSIADFWSIDTVSVYNENLVYVYNTNGYKSKNINLWNTSARGDAFSWQEQFQKQIDSFPIPKDDSQAINDGGGYRSGISGVYVGPWIIIVKPVRTPGDVMLIRTKGNIQDAMEFKRPWDMSVGVADSMDYWGINMTCLFLWDDLNADHAGNALDWAVNMRFSGGLFGQDNFMFQLGSSGTGAYTITYAELKDAFK